MTLGCAPWLHFPLHTLGVQSGAGPRAVVFHVQASCLVGSGKGLQRKCSFGPRRWRYVFSRTCEGTPAMGGAGVPAMGLGRGFLKGVTKGFRFLLGASMAC